MRLEDWVALGIPVEIVNDAIDWVIKLDSNAISDADYAHFSDWLEEELIHQWAYEELSTLWAKSPPHKRHINVVPTPKAKGGYSMLQFSIVMILCLTGLAFSLMSPAQ